MLLSSKAFLFNVSFEGNIKEVLFPIVRGLCAPLAGRTLKDKYEFLFILICLKRKAEVQGIAMGLSRAN